MVAVKNANTTIHYMGDISYFSTIKSKKYKSKVEMVQAHLKYLNKNLVASVGSKDMILSTAKKLDKRVNSRVAMKFHIAIPNDIPREHYNEFLNEVAIFLENQFNIDRNNIYIVLHETHKLGKTFGTENKHIHVVANTRTKDDKQIRLQPKDLSELHKNWDQFLMNYGYKIRKDKSKNNFKLGVKLRKDAELQALYKQHLNSQREIEALEREIRLAEMDRKLAKERAEREAREKAEREARERAERERAEREAREKAEREAREKAEREARERAEREARERAEKEARERAEREKAEKEARERAEREKAEREAREKAEREARERAEREARERAERERAEQERLAKEKAEKEAKAKAERERILRERAEKERQMREQIRKDIIEKRKLAQEQEARERAEKEKAYLDDIRQLTFNGLKDVIDTFKQELTALKDELNELKKVKANPEIVERMKQIRKDIDDHELVIHLAEQELAMRQKVRRQYQEQENTADKIISRLDELLNILNQEKEQDQEQDPGQDQNNDDGLNWGGMNL